MKVHCQTCGTNFRLDDSQIPPEGAWVRCSQCGDVFQVAFEARQTPHPAESPTPEQEQVPPQDAEPIPESPPQEHEPIAPPQEPTPSQAGGFWAEEAAASSLDLFLMERTEQERALKRADFSLEQRPEIAERPPRGPLFKAMFWLIGIVLLAVITALGSVVVMSRLGVGNAIVERAARLPGMAPPT